MAGDKFKTYTEYALGMLAESAWIVAVSVLAFLMAVIAKVIWP